MPIYKEILEIVSGNGIRTKLFVFDYSEVKIPENQKRMICLDSCITIGTKLLEDVDDVQLKRALTAGQEYSGYFVRTINGPYDYCFKIWTDRRLPFAPLNTRIPEENEPQDALIIDRNEDLLGIACGAHLAYCSIQSLDDIGYSLNEKVLPIAGLKVKLRREKHNRPEAIPYAAFRAIPVPDEPQMKEESEIKEENQNIEENEIKAEQNNEENHQTEEKLIIKEENNQHEEENQNKEENENKEESGIKENEY